MTIFFSKFFVFFVLCLFLQPALGADNETDNLTDNVSNNKIQQLEQRIADLESIVQMLLKKNDQKSSENITQKLITEDQKSSPQYAHITNKQNIAKNSTAIERTEVMYDQAELAIYSYEDLTEEMSKSLKVAGYADVEYKGSSSSGVNEEFRMHHLSLFFSKQFDNRLKFFSEIEFEDTPKFEGQNDGSGDLKESSGKIFVEAVNFDWNYSQYLNVRLGRFFTPAGIWSEDHYPPFVTTQERPLHIRKIFPQLVDGISFFGSTEFTANHFFNYTTFYGNGESNVSGKKDVNSSKSVGFKGDYHAPWLDDFTVGFTLYNDNNDSSNNNAEKLAYGYHLKLRQENFTVQAEYAAADLAFVNPLADYKSKGYYTQFLYSLGQWGIGYRYDVFDKTDIDIEKIKRNSFFINYHLNEYLTLKGEYHDDSHDDPLINEYGYYIISVTGYLGN